MARCRLRNSHGHFHRYFIPLRRLSRSMQHKNHDPVKIIRRINEFTWTMSKLRLIVENSLDGNENQVKTCLQNFISNVKKNNDEYFYQDIKLHKYETTIVRAMDIYCSAITNIYSKVEARFSSLLDSVIFKNIPLLLDTSALPKDDSAIFGDKEINDHFNALLGKNGCDVQRINKEWIRLKLFILPILQNNQEESYLEIWRRSFANTELMSDCKNVMHLFEIVLVVPFTNAIVERVFSRMNRVKTDFRNRLSRSRLDTCLRGGEDRTSIEDFNPDRVIECWWNEKRRRLQSRPHNYPVKKVPRSSEFVNLSSLTMSDLENSDIDEA